MTDTATKILDSAQELMQTRGYCAMSFQDIADVVGIKKPSIIHHFPGKTALGVAVVRRYRLYFSEAMEAIKANPEKTAWEALEFYFTPYLGFGETPDKVCLCGALAGEFMALPPEMRAEVKIFFEDHQRWLEGILRKGKKEGDFHFDDRLAHMASLLLSALQGGLLLKRSTGDIDQFVRVIESIRNTLKKKKSPDR